MSPAPIAYFSFNRPEHTARTLAALAANPEAIHTELYVFVDGPRSDAERPLVDEVTRIVHAARGFGRIEVHAANANRGLYRSITEGVGKVIASHGRVIVVEDDVLVTTFFLAYMNDALERYASVPEAGAIHAYSPPLAGLPDYFFLRGSSCWGWATWADRWALFRPNAKALLQELRHNRLIDAFCARQGSQSLLLLERRALGRNQSWAILWHASLFLAGRYTLYPGVSLAANIGFDGSGTHTANSAHFSTPVATKYCGPPAIRVDEDLRAAAVLSAYLDNIAIGEIRWLNPMLLRIYAKLALRLPFLL